MKELAISAVATARKKGLPLENYWLYFKTDGSAADASGEENKRKNYIGFFVEDDSRIQTRVTVAEKKIKRYGK